MSQDLFPQPVGRPIMDSAAYVGVLGAICDHAAPYSEADKAGILASLLSSASAALGRTAAVMVDLKEHPVNISTLLLGSTGHGRKGTAMSVAEYFMGIACPEFMEDNIVRGLTSGEGLIAEVRDPSVEDMTLMEAMSGEKPVVGGRRALVLDEEFEGTMANFGGGTLAATLRKCWDGSSLSNPTKKDAMKATRPHVVVTGHATPQAFATRVKSVHAAGGTYNRFLVFYVNQSCFISETERTARWLKAAQRLGEALGVAIDKIRVGHDDGTTTLVRMDAAAKALWKKSLHKELSYSPDDMPPIVQQFTTRQAPYSLRLAALYALLDGRFEISAEDLMAARAIVNYSMASVVFISAEFAAAADNEKPVQREHRRIVTELLREAKEEGVTLTDIRRRFGNKVDASEIVTIAERIGAHKTYRTEGSSKKPTMRYYDSQFPPKED